MQTQTRNHRKNDLAENAIAKKVLEEIQRIEAEANEKKLAQLESLQQAKANIAERIEQLQHQLEQVEKAIAVVTGGKPAAAKRVERRQRRNLEEVRERLARWMEGRRGQKFMAGDLVKEFPELDGVAVSIFMKPLTQAGQVKTDTSEGNRRMKYYVE